MNIGANAFTTGDGQRYWLAGLWTSNGTLVWSSEPESYPSRAAALAAARQQKHLDPNADPRIRSHTSYRL